jgi:hypothetical protein
MKIIENVVDYVIGNKTADYYHKLIKKFPKNAAEYKDEMYSQIILGKIVPNVIDISSLIIGLTYDSFWFIGIGAGETLRNGLYQELKENKEDHKKRHKLKTEFFLQKPI